MGTYIFNSESLWNKQTKDLPAAKESDDYYKSSELIQAWENIDFENET
jgi:hypothetical protein